MTRLLCLVFSCCLVFAQQQQSQQQKFRSKVAIYDLKMKKSTVIFEQDGILEAPNWARDGKTLLVNTGGKLYRMNVEGGPAKLGDPIEFTPGRGYRCNNDHDYSPDGKLIAFSASSALSQQSQVYVANADGTAARLLTPASPSYFHGWSPDGKWLAFVGRRDGKFELFRVSVNGGEEQRLTSSGTYDDGPEYSRDGKWIYFNSNRGGGWNIWRMPADGAGPGDALAERITNDPLEDWFAHFSPNGKYMVFLSFPAGTEGHNGRMPGMQLRMMKAPGFHALRHIAHPKGKLKASPMIEVLETFSGGQGTINVNSWSPDSKRFAYVIYEPLP